VANTEGVAQNRILARPARPEKNNSIFEIDPQVYPRRPSLTVRCPTSPAFGCFSLLLINREYKAPHGGQSTGFLKSVLEDGKTKGGNCIIPRFLPVGPPGGPRKQPSRAPHRPKSPHLSPTPFALAQAIFGGPVRPARNRPGRKIPPGVTPPYSHRVTWGKAGPGPRSPVASPRPNFPIRNQRSSRGFALPPWAQQKSQSINIPKSLEPPDSLP